VRESAVRIGLIGLGRIGRNIVRQAEENPNLEVVAIADYASADGLAYLLKYDSIYGRFKAEVAHTEDSISIDGRSIPLVDGRDPASVDWASFNVDVVIQAIGSPRNRAWSEALLSAGAPRVIVASTPEVPGQLPVYVPGVSDASVLDEPIISMGSNTAQAAVPVLASLMESFGVERGFLTTVHAFTSNQRLADSPTDGLRSSRAAGDNIIPSPSNSAEVIAQVLPALEGKLIATALNVPVPDGSTIDMVVELSKPATAEEINNALEAASERLGAGLDVTHDPIVSTDVIGVLSSGIVDAISTTVTGGTMVKLIIWFDNGWGYTARIMEALEGSSK
jgi:glyceraldehyde 3-phosphate dehydrogenase